MKHGLKKRTAMLIISEQLTIWKSYWIKSCMSTKNIDRRRRSFTAWIYNCWIKFISFFQDHFKLVNIALLDIPLFRHELKFWADQTIKCIYFVIVLFLILISNEIQVHCVHEFLLSHICIFLIQFSTFLLFCCIQGSCFWVGMIFCD